MAFQGPSVPHRTGRKRALEIGTVPAGFTGTIDVDPDARAPKGTKGGQPYKEQPPAVGGSPSPSEAPFTVGGGK